MECSTENSKSNGSVTPLPADPVPGRQSTATDTGTRLDSPDSVPTPSEPVYSSLVLALPGGCVVPGGRPSPLPSSVSLFAPRGLLG